MTVTLGQDIVLALKLLKNGKPQGGKTVSVRVLRSDDGATLLVDTGAPETVETGLYSFTWTTPVSERTSVLAIFSEGNSEFSEFIDILEGPVIKGAETLVGILDEGGAQVGTLDEDELVGTLTEEEQVGTVSDEDEQIGVQDDSGAQVGEVT